MAVTVKMEGSKEMELLLKELRNDTFKKKVLTSAYRKAAKPFVKTARSAAPMAKEDGVDNAGNVIPKGFIKKNIKTWTYRNIRAPHLLMGVKLSRKQKTDGGYWFFKHNELGTVHQSAKPFLQPSFDKTKGAMGGIVSSEFDGIFKKFKNKYNL